MSNNNPLVGWVAAEPHTESEIRLDIPSPRARITMTPRIEDDDVTFGYLIDRREDMDNLWTVLLYWENKGGVFVPVDYEIVPLP